MQQIIISCTKYFGIILARPCGVAASLGAQEYLSPIRSHSHAQSEAAADIDKGQKAETYTIIDSDKTDRQTDPLNDRSTRR